MESLDQNKPILNLIQWVREELVLNLDFVKMEFEVGDVWLMYSIISIGFNLIY